MPSLPRLSVYLKDRYCDPQSERPDDPRALGRATITYSLFAGIKDEACIRCLDRPPMVALKPDAIANFLCKFPRT